MTYPKARPRYSDGFPSNIILGGSGIVLFLVGVFQVEPGRRLAYAAFVGMASMLVVWAIVKWYQGQLHKYPAPDSSEVAVEQIAAPSKASSTASRVFLAGAAGPFVARIVVSSAVAASVMVVGVASILTAVACALHFKVTGRRYR